MWVLLLLLLLLPKAVACELRIVVPVRRRRQGKGGSMGEEGLSVYEARGETNTELH